MIDDNISFDLPKNRSNVIKVIGVGGGGGNAVGYMYNTGLRDVDFVVCNTDAQALQQCPVPNKIQLGVVLTEGLGAGANPEIGRKSVEESMQEIEEVLKINTKMIFLTAGMGGGTGTGAAPVIAKMASDLGILTVAVVTVPFKYEGRTRLEQAKIGVEKLRNHVDSLIIVNNTKLRDVYGNVSYKIGFEKADEVLAMAVKGISQVITKHYGMNIDLKDVSTVLSKSGTAIMGSAEASGEGRALKVIKSALDSPLLNDNKITGAKNVLLSFISGEDAITLDEMDEISNYVVSEAGGDVNIIQGVGDDLNLGDKIGVTVIATGFSREQQDVQIEKEPVRKVHDLIDDKSDNKGNTIHTKSVVPSENTERIKIKSEDKRIIHVLEEEDYHKNNLDDGDDLSKQSNINSTERIIKEENKKTSYKYLDKDDFGGDSIDSGTVTSKVSNEVYFDEIENFNNLSNGDENKTTEKKRIFKLEDVEEEKIYSKSNHIDIRNISSDNEIFRDGSKKFHLDAYSELENKIMHSKPKNAIKNEIELEKQKMTSRREGIPLVKKNKIIEGRTEKLSSFNKNNNFLSRIPTTDEMYDQPAYKRAGLDITSSPSNDNNISKYSLGRKDDNDSSIKPDNSFLHGNVD